MLDAGLILQMMVPIGLCGLGLAVANVILLLTVGKEWYQMYHQFSTDVVLGVLFFSVVLLIENVFAIYFFGMIELTSSEPGTLAETMAILRGVQCIGLLAVCSAMLPNMNYGSSVPG
jgi:hypothetical protein